MALVTAGAAALAADGPKPVIFALDGKDWSFHFELQGFHAEKSDLLRNERGGRSRQLLARDGAGFTVSVFIEEEPGGGFADLAALREANWPSERLQGLVNFRVADDATSTVSYSVPEFQGVKVNQVSRHAYWIRGDCWVEVHFSKLDYHPQDRERFDRFFAAAGLGPAPEPSSGPLIAVASRAYLAHRYANAAPLYQQALDLERGHRTVSDVVLKVVIDNLGMAYGITHEYAKADETYRYGISVFPTYPMFHYNLACNFAETGRLEDAIASLRLAYRYRANQIAGEHFPDPRQDSSFQRYLHDPQDSRLVRALEEMERQP